MHAVESRIQLREHAGRATLAILVAAVAGYLTWLLANPAVYVTDFQYLWHGARLWTDGIDPYAMRPSPESKDLWPLWDRLFYPLPALLVVAPFTRMALRVAQVAFIAAGAGLLAWRMTRDSLWPLLIFVSPSFALTALLGQWSPWLTTAALVPSAGFLLACKPTLGLACFTYRPSWRAVASGSLIVVVSLAVMPSWPVQWLDNLRSVRQHPAPILTPMGGWLLALAALRWRTREGRFLLAMACVPQLLFFADQLPLFLVARTLREAVLYTLAGLVVGVALLAPALGHPVDAAMAAPYVMLGCYLPALWIVMRRPNVGAIHPWLERRVIGWPVWLRGRDEATS